MTYLRIGCPRTTRDLSTDGRIWPTPTEAIAGLDGRCLTVAEGLARQCSTLPVYPPPANGRFILFAVTQGHTGIARLRPGDVADGQLQNVRFLTCVSLHNTAVSGGR